MYRENLITLEKLWSTNCQHCISINLLGQFGFRFGYTNHQIQQQLNLIKLST